jgi:hypothetical protein
VVIKLNRGQKWGREVFAATQLGLADIRTTEKHYAHLAPSYFAQTIRANFPVLGLADGADVIPLRRAKKA